MFPADNPWNQRVDGLTRRSDSDAIIARIQRDGGDFLHADFGENPAYGIPFVDRPRRPGAGAAPLHRLRRRERSRPLPDPGRRADRSRQ